MRFACDPTHVEEIMTKGGPVPFQCVTDVCKFLRFVRDIIIEDYPYGLTTPEECSLYGLFEPGHKENTGDVLVPEKRG